MNLDAWSSLIGIAQAPHTILAELMQLDTLYWPVVQVAQLVHIELVVMPNPVEYVPVWQVVQCIALEAARPVENVPAMQEIHLLDEVSPLPVLYIPVGQASQFTPFQFAGGSSWVPTGKFCQVVFHPPSPVKPALQVQAVWVPALLV